MPPVWHWTIGKRCQSSNACSLSPACGGGEKQSVPATQPRPSFVKQPTFPAVIARSESRPTFARFVSSVGCSPPKPERVAWKQSSLSGTNWIASPSLRSGYAMTKEIRKRNAGKRRSVPPAPSGCGTRHGECGLRRPSAVGRARLPAFHHGSRQGDLRRPPRNPGHASWDAAGALGPKQPPQPGGGDLRSFNGRYPPRPVPVQ